jgi:hypothetical protein
MSKWHIDAQLLLILISSLIIINCAGSRKAASSIPIIPKVDLSHWKVTIPTPDSNGRPLEFSPPEILNYTEIEELHKFMYADSTDGSIVFYAYPASSTANSKYSRSELREQMVPGDNDTNWKFAKGGNMKVTMSVPKVSKDDYKKGHRLIIAQIHGKLSKEQQKLIGQKDTNAPPILKIYYQDGIIQVKTKKLKISNPTLEETLVTKNWVDDEGYFFKKYVGSKKFTLEVIASDGAIVVVLNGEELVVRKSESIKQWGIFYNYFKVGNYLNTRDVGAYAKVKIYDLEVKH